MASVHIITFGCSLNQSDSEVMAGTLQQHGFTIVDDPVQADVVIINSCTVKQHAEDKLYKAITALEQQGKKIVVAGCVPQGDRLLAQGKLKGYSLLGTTQLQRIAEVVEQTLDGNVVHILGRQIRDARPVMLKIRRNPVIEIIPINEGCLGSCTYCKTVHARGRLKSYDPDVIKEQMRHAVDDGCKEIWLTSQDTACYGMDLQPAWNLPSLLRHLLTVRGNYRIRVGMGNPTFMVKFIDELVEVLEHPKMFKFLHVPVQSGSNRILQLMNREYTVEDYEKIVRVARERDPRITIATDVIVAFPTETDAEFKETLALIERTQPDVINISRFWPRPGTKAVRMKPIDGKTSTIRARLMTETAHRVMLERNTQWLGWEGDVLVDEIKGEANDGAVVARNDYYKHVLLPADAAALGDVVRVRVEKTTHYDLQARPL